ncbi:YceI family protein [Nocardia stercoris]|uniref:Lipid/polyisoprenoid-binding YceI-like domain-containing protein n=1 Tax=Nocardia stercoris TaxID=2483361 RepID=A0A3M2KZS5_9NOCA|nr:YceI family protein [Nocardia stercoris]RMI30156.1 hypothetical protein EBN03_23330 [Nocardia stercoris]
MPVATPHDLTPGIWPLNKRRSAVNFTTHHMKVSKVNGQFTTFTAEFTVHDDSLATATATIELDSMDTGSATRDAAVWAANLLDVKQ